MKIIILDIDGVCNDACTTTKHVSEGRVYDGVDKEKIDLLKKIIDATGAKIILSSTWRKYKDSREYLFKEMGERLASCVIGQTPDFGFHLRADEIESWLNDHPEVTKFIVLDDQDSEDLERFGSSFIQTKMSTGLTEEDAVKCIEKLS